MQTSTPRSPHGTKPNRYLPNSELFSISQWRTSERGSLFSFGFVHLGKLQNVIIIKTALLPKFNIFSILNSSLLNKVVSLIRLTTECCVLRLKVL